MSGADRVVGQWPDFTAPPNYPDAPGEWSDPDLPNFRVIWSVARDHGYAVGLHGSMRRDCDLIAVPWTDKAVRPAELVSALCEALNAREVGSREPKPHGRIALNLQVDGWVKLIDLSIVEPVVGPHKWWVWHGIMCCEVCGIVRNNNNADKPCRGPVAVGPRAPAGRSILAEGRGE